MHLVGFIITYTQYIHTYIHNTYTKIHTYTHKYIHNTYITYVHTYTHTHRHTSVYTYIHTHTHMYIHTNVNRSSLLSILILHSTNAQVFHTVSFLQVSPLKPCTRGSLPSPPHLPSFVHRNNTWVDDNSWNSALCSFVQPPTASSL